MYYLLTATSVIGPWDDEYSAVSFQADLHGENYYAWGLLICSPEQVDFLTQGIRDRPIYSVPEYVVAFDLAAKFEWDEGINTKPLEDQYGPQVFTEGTAQYRKFKADIQKRSKE